MEVEVSEVHYVRQNGPTYPDISNARKYAENRCYYNDFIMRLVGEFYKVHSARLIQ